jgi:hypothetical protein
MPLSSRSPRTFTGYPTGTYSSTFRYPSVRHLVGWTRNGVPAMRGVTSSPFCAGSHRSRRLPASISAPTGSTATRPVLSSPWKAIGCPFWGDDPHKPATLLPPVVPLHDSLGHRAAGHAGVAGVLASQRCCAVHGSGDLDHLAGDRLVQRDDQGAGHEAQELQLRCIRRYWMSQARSTPAAWGNTAWRSSGTFLAASGSTRPHCLCSLDSLGLAACFSRRAQCKKPLGCSLCRVGEQHRKDMSTSEPRRRAGPPAGTLR